MFTKAISLTILGYSSNSLLIMTDFSKWKLEIQKGTLKGYVTKNITKEGNAYQGVEPVLNKFTIIFEGRRLAFQ